ncbi:TlpA disulfide reductase family protein [Bradyrhizobium sp. CIR48]|uniref:TlpA disulfide reductase family protein n=1 Tax=Bradyrhizobium sp. CIR48 TaxID=2663840 RepID=UPI001FED6EC1|nr:TlpA disulfide reductase family protein [Bradyrhizobium sp. CIR48]
MWPAWSAPCVAALSDLVQLQEKYRDSGVEVLGIAARERAQTAEEARSKLDPSLTKRVPNLNYRIGFNYTREMDKLWMDSSFSVGIPTSFLVGRDGRIAFIGSPTQLNDVLPKILTGRWRISDEAKAADAERIAEGERTMPISAKLTAAMAQDWAKALSVVEEAVAVLPDDVNFRVLHADLLLHKMHEVQAGLPVMMRQLVREAIDKKSALWMAGAMRQLFDSANDSSYLPQAERFAMGNELSKHILAVNPPQHDEAPKFLSYPALAQYCYESGDRSRDRGDAEVAGRPRTYLGQTETAGYVGIGPNAGQLQGSEGLPLVSMCDSATRSSAKVPKRKRRRRKDAKESDADPAYLAHTSSDRARLADVSDRCSQPEELAKREALQLSAYAKSGRNG